MRVWRRLRDVLPDWRSNRHKKLRKTAESGGDAHLLIARESLRDLLADGRVPSDVREALAVDYEQVKIMLEKLEHGHIHIAVFGRVSVGKTTLVNALLGEERFSTSPLHGETLTAQRGRWEEFRDGNVFLIDTPGINEVNGELREQLAHEVAERSDLILFVVEADLTAPEFTALNRLAVTQRPLLLVLNKVDRYNQRERERLLGVLAKRVAKLLPLENLVSAAAAPREQLVIRVDAQGNEVEEIRQPPPNVQAVRDRLWTVLERDGKTLTALNASLFAGQLSSQIAGRVLNARRTLGERVIRTWCIAKGVAVALNPIPVADLIAAAAVDISMIVHLSRVYGFPLTRTEAGSLVKTIGGQMLLLMGTVWVMNLASSALKFGTGGFSAVVTGGAQGAVAYYGTLVVGLAAERYLANGKSWGAGGPKAAVREILDSLDRGSILEQARADIRERLRTG